MSLCAARRNLANSKRTVIVAYGADRSGQRILVEIMTYEGDRTVGVPSGWRLITLGLSFATDDALMLYKDAEQNARAASKGMYQYGEVFTGPELKPWALKHDSEMLDCSVKEADARTIDGVTYFAQVINETEKSKRMPPHGCQKHNSRCGIWPIRSTSITPWRKGCSHSER